MTKEELIEFEDSIAAEFNAGKIRYPVHLESGNEDALIDVFKNVHANDYIFGTWRLHLKALLKGVPPDELHAAIHRGESMSLKFHEHRVYGSAVAGGIVPIALGAAMAIKRKGEYAHVWCFIGDMVEHCGITRECMAYGANHGLPITWIVEENGVSVCTPVNEVWKEQKEPHVIRYQYRSKYPHAGGGTRVQF